MALIKGPRYRPQDGEPEPRKDKSQEEPQKRGGLIKGGAMSAKFLSDSPLPSEYSSGAPRSKQRIATSGKVLKAKWASVLGGGEGGEGAPAPRGRDTQILKSSEFQAASFMTQPGGPEAGGIARNVIMVPSNENQASRQHSPVEEEGGDFVVEQMSMGSRVDVDAIVAEAEERGREKAARIIEHAQAEAKKLIDQAKIYGETAKQEAQKEGLLQGKEDGYREGLAQFTAMMDEVKNLFSQLVKERQRVFEEVEPELASLSLDIAKTVIGNEVRTNPDAVIGIVKKALSHMKSREEVVIKVNPEDLEHVKHNRDVFAAMVEGVQNMEIAADPRVGRGGCLIQTNLGSTDARIETQIGVIELAFKRAETGQF